MRVQRFLAALTAVVALNGCKKDGDAPAAEPTAAQPGPTTGKSEPEAAQPLAVEGESGGGETAAQAPVDKPPVGEPAASDAEQQALAAAYTARTCVLKRLDREGNKAIDAQYGFKDAADFAKRWVAAAATNPAWAETVMAEALAKDCTPK